MKKLVIFILVAFLLTFGATPVYANGTPPLPHAFYGNVTINGSPAPDGTQISATVAEGEVLTTSQNPIATVNGNYGIDGLHLLVQGYDLSGAITFYVNGVEVEGATATFEAGGGPTQVDLSVTIALVEPAVTTASATGVGTTTATLNGTLTNLGSASSVEVSFEWGTSTSYSEETPVETRTSTGPFSATISGLSPSTTYHFRAKAGTSYGIDRSFTTEAAGGGGGGGGGFGPTYYIQANLFGTEGSYHIGSSGKILETIEATSADGNLTITIPKDTIALDKDGNRLESLEAAVDKSPPAAPEDAHIIGLAYDFGPDGATFDPPIELIINYDPEELPENVSSLFIASYDEEQGWRQLAPISGFVATVGTATAQVGHFTTFAAIATVEPPVPAAFTVSKLIISPAKVDIGQSVTITAVVANTGGETGSCEAVLKIDGVLEATKEVTISAGASEEVTFTTSRDVAGSYSVDVNGLTGSFTVKEEPAPPAAPPEEAPPVKPFPWPLIGGIAAGVVIVGLLIFFLVRRRARARQWGA